MIKFQAHVAQTPLMPLIDGGIRTLAFPPDVTPTFELQLVDVAAARRVKPTGRVAPRQRGRNWNG